jgi:hypothetical protein
MTEDRPAPLPVFPHNLVIPNPRECSMVGSRGEGSHFRQVQFMIEVLFIKKERPIRIKWRKEREFVPGIGKAIS